jgi:hypothetical protein
MWHLQKPKQIHLIKSEIAQEEDKILEFSQIKYMIKYTESKKYINAEYDRLLKSFE